MFADYIRTLVLSSDGTKVMMRADEDGLWDLPYHVFEPSHIDNYLACVPALQKQLELQDCQPCFSVITELLGNFVVRHARKCPTVVLIGFARLVWLEKHVDHIDLPPGWDWKHVGFVHSLEAPKEYDRAFEKSMIQTGALMIREPSLMRELSQPRHQQGWIRRAGLWLKDVAMEQGATVENVVCQVRVSPCSTILSVKSTSGRFFLKSPNDGPTEIKITVAIQQIMPDRTLEVVGVSEELNSFVSKEFETVYERKDEESRLHFMMVRELASLQLASVEHKEALMATECPLLGPEELILELDEWLADAGLWTATPPIMKSLEKLAPHMKELLLGLQDYNIPLTLTHGDFARRNVGFKKSSQDEQGLILFDWQCTAISHPFFDFHDFDREVSGATLDEYLKHWTRFESLKRCREAYDIAHGLGWLLKLRVTIINFRAYNYGNGGRADFLGVFQRLNSAVEFFLRNNKYPNPRKERHCIDNQAMRSDTD